VIRKAAPVTLLLLATALTLVSCGGGGPPAPGPEPEFPQFRPWPPPRPTDRMVLPPAFFIDDKTLGEVAKDLESAFVTQDYGYTSYYAIPGGFALVSRIEQVNPDGRSMQPPARWEADVHPPEINGIRDFIEALFYAAEGRYRLILFTVTAKRFTDSGEEVSREEADRWLGGGWDWLPEAVAEKPFTSRHRVNALIYEFDKPPRAEAVHRTSPRFTARQHLELAGLWQLLAR